MRPKAVVFLLLLGISVLLLLSSCRREDSLSLPDTLFYRIIGIHNRQCVGHINGEEVPAELYLHWLRYSCRYWDSYVYDNSGQHIDWAAPLGGSTTYGDFAKSEAWELCKLQILTEQWYTEYGAELSSQQEQALNDERQQYIEYYGDEDAYLLALSKQGVSQQTFDRIRRLGAVYTALQQRSQSSDCPLYPSTEQLRHFGQEQAYLTIDYILLRTTDPSTGEDLGEDVKQQKFRQAQALQTQLQRSAEPDTLFQQLASLYSEDPQRVLHPDGQTMKATQLPQDLTLAGELAENQCSDILHTQDGYLLLFRRPLQVDSLRSEYFTAAFQAALDSVSWESDPILEHLDVDKFFQRLPPVSAGTQPL